MAIMSNNECGLLINDHHTDIVLKVYSNRIFAVVTQFKKFGSMISVTRESLPNQYNSDTFSTHIIFGKDTDEIHSAARYIAEAINIDRPLLLSIALYDYEVCTLKNIITVVNKIKTW